MENNSRLVQKNVGNFSWVVSEDWQEKFFFALQARLENGEILRATPDRQVIHLRGKSHPLVVKHFYHSGILGVIKALLRGSPAAREWKSLRESEHRGLPTPKAVAWGQSRGILKRESLLATDTLVGAVNLRDYLLGSSRPVTSGRWRVIRDVAVTIRQAHDLGLYHHDLHLGNILIRTAGGRIEVFLIDLQRARFYSTLTPQMRWQNLAVLHGGSLEISFTDNLRFLKAYLTAHPPLAFDILRALTARLVTEGRRHRLRNWRSRDRRCVSGNQEFMSLRTGGFSGNVRRDHWKGDIQELLLTPQGLLTHPGIQLIKDSRTTTVGKLTLGGRTLYVKRYNYQGMLYAIKDMCRSSRARRVWIAANGLRMRGIEVPLPIAYLERRRLGALQESYVITNALQNGLHLGENTLRDRGCFARNNKETGAPKRGDMMNTFDAYFNPLSWPLEKHLLIRDLALFLRKMHDNGVSHRDLKEANLVVQRENPGYYRFSIVDFDGARLGWVSWRRRIKNLARLAWAFHGHPAIYRTNRCKFLKTYLGGREGKKWRSLWKAIAKSVQNRVA